jgi:probable HAF family extracellular repeat protein
VVYRDGVLSELPGLEPDLDTYAADINDRGEIVGYSLHYSFGRPRPLLWHNGRVIDLGLQTGWETGTAIAVNDRGVIVASGTRNSSDPKSFEIALIYPDGRITPMPVPPMEVNWFGPREINNRNEVIAISERFWSGSPWQSWLYSNGVLYDLQTLIEPASEYVLDGVTGINDRGEIVGYGTIVREDGAAQAGFLLVPK